jgi:general secretion pathway protein J
MDPGKGGVINILVEDVQRLDIEYFDPLTKEWSGEWDTTQAAGQPWRLPMQVRITLVINGGPGGRPITLRSRVSPAIQTALEFAN